METVLLKAAPPKRKRRWFQFSLRTLMIVVTLLAVPLGYVGWQAKIVMERKAEIRRGVSGRAFMSEDMGPPAWMSYLRYRLGDNNITVIQVPANTDSDEMNRLRTLFPEADIDARDGPPASLQNRSQ
jgi:hypothetical protein